MHIDNAFDIDPEKLFHSYTYSHWSLAREGWAFLSNIEGHSGKPLNEIWDTIPAEEKESIAKQTADYLLELC
jgi:hypothetical protein